MSGLHRRLLVPAVALLLAACTAGRAGGEEDEPEDGAGDVWIEVDNDLVPRTPLTVRIVSRAGGRRILGNVSPGGSETLKYEDVGHRGPFHLLAQTAAGQEIRSREFDLFPGAFVSWSPRTNTLSLGVVDPFDNQ